MTLKPIGWYRNSSGCFICTSHKASGVPGHPKMRRRGRQAHIVRFILIKRLGDIGPDMVARHTCDNPKCINPSHVIPGTHRQNFRDMYDRNRHAKGERIHCSKLTADNVRAIRASDDSLRVLGKRFGVSFSAIQHIRKNIVWKHVS